MQGQELGEEDIGQLCLLDIKQMHCHSLQPLQLLLGQMHVRKRRATRVN